MRVEWRRRKVVAYEYLFIRKNQVIVSITCYERLPDTEIIISSLALTSRTEILNFYYVHVTDEIIILIVRFRVLYFMRQTVKNTCKRVRFIVSRRGLYRP